MSLNVLILLVLIGGWGAGRAASRLGLPSVLGMILWGIALALIVGGELPPALGEIGPFLKSLALIIILLRAGLGIRRATLQKVGRAALFMAFLPCLFEGGALTVLFHFLMDFPWPAAGVTGFLLAAVSPAVVVPSMLDMKDRGLGAEREVPTLILAGASLDDVFAITLFSLFLGLAGGERISPVLTLLRMPLAIVGGILPGIAAGLLLTWFFRRHREKIRATEKVLLLLGTAMLLVDVGHWIHTAALLGVMTTGFILLERAEEAAHELAAKLNKAWVFAEIVLFVLIGLSVDVRVALRAGKIGLLIITAGLVFRSLGVWAATMGSALNRKERLFCVIAYLPKATVQAAMGSVPLAVGLPEGELILALAVLAILFTAPLGLIGIRRFGPRLLEPAPPQGAGS